MSRLIFAGAEGVAAGPRGGGAAAGGGPAERGDPVGEGPGRVDDGSACGGDPAGVLDGDPEVRGDARQAVRITLADGAHLPGPRPPVDLDAQQRGLRAEAFGDEPHDRLPGHGHVHPQVAERAERGRAAAVEARGDDDALDRGIDGRRLDVDACRVVAHTRREGLVVEDEVGVATHFARRRHQQRGDVDGRGCGDADGDGTGRERRVPPSTRVCAHPILPAPRHPATAQPAEFHLHRDPTRTPRDRRLGAKGGHFCPLLRRGDDHGPAAAPSRSRCDRCTAILGSVSTTSRRTR